MKARRIPVLLLAPLLAAGILPMRKDPEVEAGRDKRLQGDHEAAVRVFRGALREGDTSGIGYYNLGTALLGVAMETESSEARKELLEEATTSLRSALVSDKASLRQKARFNLGNAEARLGLWDEAARSYRSVLLADPSNEAASHNLEVVLLWRERAAAQTRRAGEAGQGDGTSAGYGAAGRSDEGSDAAGSDGGAPGHGTRSGQPETSTAQGGEGDRGMRAEPRAMAPERDLQSQLADKLRALELRSSELRRKRIREKSSDVLRRRRTRGGRDADGS